MSSGNDRDVRTMVDREAIRDLIFRYSDSVTRGDFERLATFFSPDAVWESPLLDLRFESAGAFIDFLSGGSGSLDVLIQTPHSPVVDLVSSERATATTTIHEMVRGTLIESGVFGDAGAETNVEQHGIYHDEIVKFDEEWKFTHRLFVPFLIATGTVVGDVTSTRPLLRPT
jgi:hypothetical protein